MDTSDRLFEARLAEYVSARTDMCQAIGHQHTTLAFGTAALVTAFGAGFVSWGKAPAPAIFAAIMPLSWWILVMWMGEVARMLRSVQFCTEQEPLVNALAPSDDPRFPALRWERWRQDPEQAWRTIRWTYVSVGLLLGVVNVAALTCTTVTAHGSGWSSWVVWPIWVIVGIAAVLLSRWVPRVLSDTGAMEIGLREQGLVAWLVRLRIVARPTPPATTGDGEAEA